MKHSARKYLAVITVTGILAAAPLARAATVNVTATAVVQAATLTLTKVTDVDFGSIVASSQASNVTIDASAGAGTPAVTSGNASVSGGTSGLVTVGTNINSNVTISFAITGADGTVQTLEDGTNDMSITNASITANSTATNLAVTVAGPNQIHIGGVLQVGANQAANTYTGTIVCTVNY